MRTFVIVGVALLLQGPGAPKPGSMLQAGAMMIYSSGGVETPWTVDSAAVDTTIAGRSGCTRLVLRLSPTARPQTRVFCADSAILWQWNDSTRSMQESRPITPKATLSIRTPRGSMLYETGTPVTEKIGGLAVWVLPTTVTTRDVSGRVVRRLTESFSLGLLTATRGTFEIPDTLRAGEWAVQRRFELIGVTGNK